MNNKNVIPVWVSVVLIALCGVAVFLNIKNFGGGQDFDLMTVAGIVELLSVLLAVCYCLAGYEKASAFLFKAVIFTHIIGMALLIASKVLGTSPFSPAITVISLFCDLIIFGFMFVFGLALDIGKKRSYCMASILVLVSVLPNVILLCSGETSGIGTGVSIILLSVIFLIMIIAKYRDKAARGSK